MQPRLFLIIVLPLMSFLHVSAKTVRINPHEDVSSQFKWKNATYVVSSILDLQGKEITIPEGSTLKIKKLALISNGRIKGNQTRLKPSRTPFMKGVNLLGSFTNAKAYLSWWEVGEDITQEVNSLFATFDGRIYLDKQGRLSSTVSIVQKLNFIVDGCKNEFVLTNMPGSGFFAKDNAKLEIKDMRITFDGPYLFKSTSYVERCFRLQHCSRSTIRIHDISFSGFKNDSDKPCSFRGIDIVDCNEGTQTYVYGIDLTDITVVGDGNEAQGPGSNYGIKVSCQTVKSGKVEIHDCKLETMCNYNNSGEMIYEDTSGIFIAGIIVDESGGQTFCKWDAIVRNCYFKDISKRNVKVQGDNVRIEDLESDCTDDFLQNYKNMYIGAEGNYLKIKGLRGRYDGTIVKITGDYLEASDINCTSELRSSDYARVFTLDGCTHEIIDNCTFSNDTYIFIYPTEKGFSERTVPTYSISNCNIHVKHLIYSTSGQEKIFNEGILVVENSNVSLCGTLCFNKQALKGFDFRRTSVTTSNESLVGNKKDGTMPTIINTKSIIRVND